MIIKIKTVIYLDGDVDVNVDSEDDDDGDVAPIQMKAEALVQRCQGVNSRR